MSWVAAAIGGAAIVGGAATYFGSENAANAEENAANNANNTQFSEWVQQQNNEKPYEEFGSNAMGELNADMPNLTSQFTMADFQQDPAYAFDLNQGEQAIQRSAAAKGILNSSGTMQNLNNYAQGMASNEYQNAYQRFVNNQQQTYNMLMGQVGVGESAAANVGAAGTNYANNVSQNQMGAGNVAAAADMSTGNTISSLAGTGANSFMNYQMMSKLFPSTPPTTSAGGFGGAMSPSNNYLGNYGGGGGTFSDLMDS